MNIQVNHEELYYKQIIYLQHKMMIELYKKDSMTTFDIYWHTQNNEIVIDTNQRLIQVYFPQETPLLIVLEGIGLGNAYVSPNVWPNERIFTDVLKTPVENQELCILKLYETYEVMCEYNREFLSSKANQVG
jgi:hypothetical protein